MAVKSKAPVPRRDAPSTASLAAVMRDVREAGFAVIPEFIDTEDVEELRQACKSRLYTFTSCGRPSPATAILGPGHVLYNKMLCCCRNVSQ